ncbi:hypothetical protein [Dyadobacter frigoris]|uniref:hypothetical protein n=1 Tax=Dyadobacter frigoris TaxID=2576211 RepID=UPI001484E9A4|nr:hypothetical protein [Dyadobacter frigoris]GLU55066.1 hypothetical protein Dfri01_45270 [Dyadobacter frigoris]
MVVVIKKDAQPSAIKDAMKAIEEDIATRKGFDVKKYAGKLQRGLDGLTYQKQVRDEWK